MSQRTKSLIEFELPDGYYDEDSDVWHRQGSMRLPTQKDRTVVIKLAGDIDNRAYRETILLSLILKSLGELEINDTNRQEIVEALTVRDVDHLSRILHRWHYEAGNGNQVTCPRCGQQWLIDLYLKEDGLPGNA